MYVNDHHNIDKLTMRVDIRKVLLKNLNEFEENIWSLNKGIVLAGFKVGILSSFI